MKTRVKKQIDLSYLDAGYNFPEEIQATELVGDEETEFMPITKAVRLKEQKIKLLEKKKVRIKDFADTIIALPEPGERLFIIGGGNIDAIHTIHCTLNLLSSIDEMYIATWSIAGDNVRDLFGMLDQKKIKSLNILIPTPFRARYRKDYTTLIEGMKYRGQKLVVCQNHSKIILMKAAGSYFVVDGSANFTGNPRIEQVNFTNSEALYNFNKEWMDSVLEKVYPEIKENTKK